jgi:hypothetical protein
MAEVARTYTGTAGFIWIDDDGTTVRFYVSCTNPATNTFGQPWYGSAGSGTFNFPAGAGTVLVASMVISSTTSVSFTMEYTGTSGLGGPATVSATIARATVPGAPTNKPWTNIGPDYATINFAAPASNGGATIDYYRVRYGKTNPPESGTYVEFTTTVAANPRTGLDPGNTYYSRIWAHNAKGFSAASGVESATTLAPARIKVGGTYKLSIAYVKVAGEYKNALPYIKASGQYKQSG